MMTSWKPEVIADSTGKWYQNALCFATKEEAETSARELASRWLAVRDWRAAESSEPVTHKLENGHLIALNDEKVHGGYED
jgi:hypothetical protein